MSLLAWMLLHTCWPSRPGQVPWLMSSPELCCAGSCVMLGMMGRGPGRLQSLSEGVPVSTGKVPLPSCLRDPGGKAVWSMGMKGLMPLSSQHRGTDPVPGLLPR